MSEHALTVTAPPAAPVNWDAELNGARMLLKSGLLPTSVKSPEAAVYIILTGRDMGLSPVQSLRSINIIQGKPEVAADMQLALFKSRGGRAVFTELTERQAVLKLTHPNGDTHTETFTMEAAKAAGLTGDNWRKYPKAMLRSRAITAGLKSVGFDVLAGVYAEGEIGGPEVTPIVEPEVVVATVVEETAPAVVVPFGPDKGKTFAELTTDELADKTRKLRDFPEKAEKYGAWLEAAEEEMERRRLATPEVAHA